MEGGRGSGLEKTCWLVPRGGEGSNCLKQPPGPAPPHGASRLPGQVVSGPAGNGGTVGVVVLVGPCPPLWRRGVPIMKAGKRFGSPWT